MTILFTPDDLAAFAEASRDVNPLHSNVAYARATAFGEPVVYGALAALKSLRHLPPRPRQSMATLLTEFRSPLFANVSYEIDCEHSPSQSVLKVKDGRRLLLRVVATFVDKPLTSEPKAIFTHGAIDTCEPAVLTVDDMGEGMLFSGLYAPDPVATRALLGSLHLPDRGVAESQAAGLLACSYLVGMRIPGRNALFYSAKLDWTAPPCELAAGTYSAQIAALHKPLGLVTLRATFGSPLALSAELKSFVRQPIRRPSPNASLLPQKALEGRVAVVIGASRGLGAAIAEALAYAGATVIGTYLHSRETIAELSDRLRSERAIFEAKQADATDASEMTTLTEDVTRRHGGIDLLVCTACPPLHPLSIDRPSRDRILRHISDSLALVVTPMSCMLESVQSRRGAILLLSSSAVENPPAEWPHYVAAKRAIEGLAEVAAVSHKAVRIWLARPPKLLTELINTPLGRQGAADPGAYAAAVVSALIAAQESPELGLRIVTSQRPVRTEQMGELSRCGRPYADF